MADVISLSNGVVTVNLNLASAGFTTDALTLPRVQRQVSRVSLFPFADGSRTAASALGDSQAEWIGTIQAATVDAMHALYQSLTKLLEQAQRWEESRIGSPVRLAYKRSGATNTAYWVVTGATPPDPTGDASPWLPDALRAKQLQVRVILTLEPVAHAGAMTSIASAVSILNNPLSNVVTAAAVPGSMPAPVSLVLTNTSGATWSSAWFAQLAADPVVFEWDNIVDATASGLGSQQFDITTQSELVVNLDWNPTTNAPVRGLVRIKVTAGVPGVLQFQFRLIAGQSGTIRQEAPWVTFNGTINEWMLVDLGSLQMPHMFTNRANQDNLSVVLLAVDVRTSDGTTVTVRADYMEVLPYRSFVKLTAAIADTQKLCYEMVARSSTFVWPMRRPDHYVTTVTAVLVANAERSGMLVLAQPGDTPMFWTAMFEATRHLVAADGTLSVQVLPSYSLGARGNA